MFLIICIVVCVLCNYYTVILNSLFIRFHLTVKYKLISIQLYIFCYAGHSVTITDIVISIHNNVVCYNGNWFHAYNVLYKTKIFLLFFCYVATCLY